MSATSSGGAGVLACSFCGKTQHQVRKLVAGPASYICDECVALASRIIEESDSGRPVRRWGRLLDRVRRLFVWARAERVALDRALHPTRLRAGS